jgi:hypothetical protein
LGCSIPDDEAAEARDDKPIGQRNDQSSPKPLARTKARLIRSSSSRRSTSDASPQNICLVILSDQMSIWRVRGSVCSRIRAAPAARGVSFEIHEMDFII